MTPSEIVTFARTSTDEVASTFLSTTTPAHLAFQSHLKFDHLSKATFRIMVMPSG